LLVWPSAISLATRSSASVSAAQRVGTCLAQVSGAGEVDDMGGPLRQAGIDRLADQAMPEQQRAALATEHPGVDRLILGLGLGDSLRGQSVEQLVRVIEGERLAEHRGHL